MSKKIGIDIGGVIIGGGTKEEGKEDTSFFGDNFLKTPMLPHVVPCIKFLVEKFGADNVYIVSKCGEKVQKKSLEFLEHHKFYEKTGFKKENIRFCLKRNEKAPICEELGITDFIDDRLEVLSYMETVSNKILFRPDEKETKKFFEFLPQVHPVTNWYQVVEKIASVEEASKILPDPKLSNEEVKKIALGMVNNSIFTSDHLRDPNELRMCFMVLALADQEFIDKLIEEDASFFYEYLSEAGPRGINGLPCFMSVRYANRADHKRIREKYTQLKELMDNA